jgi:hypothetical protein
MSIKSFDDLLKKDEQREEDGLKKKIRIRRILVGTGRIIAVPYVIEEKLIHGNFEPTREHGDDLAGHGEGEVGEIIAEGPLSESGGTGEDGDPQAGQGGGEHGIETEAYQLGKELATKLKLPNLKDKGKKIPTDEYTYDLTDRHRGSGQFLDKKATLTSVVKSNFSLGLIDENGFDTTKLIVGPQDLVYRVLSREKVWKSQAVVFFLRDYSGSMFGNRTRAIVSQHLMIYSWLLFQYDKLVIPRFFVHDTEAREVSSQQYFTASANGGTFIPSVYRKINKIVEEENLARDYNIFVFQGTDGDDFDNGQVAIPEIEQILGYVNRMGVCVIKGTYMLGRKSRFEEYISNAGITDIEDLFRMYVMSDYNVTDADNEEALKALVDQD